ncbi:GNAT family N-acetyltransferase [Paraclostridium ghonii]|uniref:RimJ/RimL family protein N-acetyltransferase n=1 Tax=Paraclostridium ghonii TaxID=29358 RepID=A0ABU0N4V6_9FIRM|nr:GNAT family N-acetyltransferase [Paeniclostridium ghonii]MDQ0558176.1 RimJ/RimL family protein N-acetyltransferase [Paeniclostridium ghonii]
MLINLDNQYIIKQVSLEQSSDIEKLYGLCSDYHMICSGREANKQDVKDIFTYTEKKTVEDSLTLGIYEYNELVGLVDIFKNYPEINTWSIGLLLLAPNKRRNKLGSLVHEELKKYALDLGVHTFRIGVLEENIVAHKFWNSLGYTKVKESNISFGEIKHIVYVYEIKLS